QHYRAQHAGVELSADVPRDLKVDADEVGVRTVLRNLLDNALKATGEGGRVTLYGSATADGIHLDVRDDGAGFEPGEADRLFDKFYRVGDEMRRTQTGSGLGLHLTRRFVELEGGTVRASSDGPGEGATFSVTWPRRRTARGTA
ncbi:MAG: ATP-binding protein, partial [Acidobacteriota bacterium]